MSHSPDATSKNEQLLQIKEFVAKSEALPFFAETVLSMDKRNPQVAARLATALRSWRSLEPARQAKARETLLMMSGSGKLSADLRDIVERTLA